MQIWLQILLNILIQNNAMILFFFNFCSPFGLSTQSFAASLSISFSLCKLFVHVISPTIPLSAPLHTCTYSHGDAVVCDVLETAIEKTLPVALHYNWKACERKR